MAEKYIFQSPFAAEINNYIDLKTRMGFSTKYVRGSLIRFDKFCIKNGITEPVFTKSNAEKWIKQRNCEVHTTHYSRINTSKLFLQYLFLKGYDVFVIHDIKYKGKDFHPHIYTSDETERYFAAVDSFIGKNRKTRIQYPVLFRILYCCGTRINETLGIRKKDVDLNKGIIKLNETKNNNQRYIVLGDDLIDLLKQYANKCFYLLSDDDYIFSNANGGRLDYKTVYCHHRIFLKEAGIPYIGDGNGPRIHDWRHHMAVYSFKQMIDSGLDMYVALPILSTYLGHKTIFATEQYVRLTIQLFPYIEDKFHKLAEQIFGGDISENN